MCVQAPNLEETWPLGPLVFGSLVDYRALYYFEFMNIGMVLRTDIAIDRRCNLLYVQAPNLEEPWPLGPLMLGALVGYRAMVLSFWSLLWFYYCSYERKFVF